MRHLIAFAAGLSLLAGAAEAQIEPYPHKSATEPLKPIGSMKPLPGLGPQRVEAPKPTSVYDPPRPPRTPQSVYAMPNPIYPGQKAPKSPYAAPY